MIHTENKPRPESNKTKPESTTRDNVNINSALNDFMCGGYLCGGGLSDASDDEHAAEILEDGTLKSQKSNKHIRESITRQGRRQPIETEDTRGEPFKGAAKVKARKAVKEVTSDESPNGELKAHHEKTVHARHAMAGVMIRGKKINCLPGKTATLVEGTKTYSDLARQMNQRAKKKKWYDVL